MTTFHAFLGCSLDGFIAGPAGELSWLTDFDEVLGDTGFDAFFASIEALAMGRVTYEAMLQFDPAFYRGVPIHVLSRTLDEGAHPNLGRSTVTVHPDLPALVDALTAAHVTRAYADGGRTVQALLAAGLLADLVLTRVPVLLGEGVPLFGRLPAPMPAQLESVRQLPAGAVQSTYRFGTASPE